jgi:FkbM family methyltransferase
MIYQRESTLPYPQPWEYVMHNIFNNTKNLFFIDVGAHDGLCSSNTAYAEMDLDWNGICVEPHPDVYPKLIKNRKCKTYNCCISENTQEVEFCSIRGYSEMLSGIKSTYDEKHMDRIKNEITTHGGELNIIKIQSKTLNNLFEENNINHVNYLSIDTEGSELNVLKSVNLNKYKIDVISAENNGYNSDVKDYLKDLYLFVGKVCHDEIYVRKS